ncbi:MAG: type III secretion system chaperone [Succinivibrionaceae bacterium]|nr:type III secretion system chaperone [Succinivibrionaceae bacterium]
MLGQHLIKNLCSGMGIDIELDESNSCTFEVDGVYLTFTVLEETNEISLAADLGALPAECGAPLAMALLEANYLHQETHGATLAAIPLTGHAALCRLLPADLLDDQAFEGITEQFINTAEFYAKVISAASSASGAPQEPPQEDSVDGMISV